MGKVVCLIPAFLSRGERTPLCSAQVRHTQLIDACGPLATSESEEGDDPKPLYLYFLQDVVLRRSVSRTSCILDTGTLVGKEATYGQTGNDC
jgi:hypothetical protein